MLQAENDSKRSQGTSRDKSDSFTDFDTTQNINKDQREKPNVSLVVPSNADDKIVLCSVVKVKNEQDENKNTYCGIDLPSQENMDDVMFVSASDATSIIKVSDSSDEESTSKKSKGSTFTDSDFPDSDAVHESCSESESEYNLKDEDERGKALRPGWKDEAVAKRVPNNTLSPRGEFNRPGLEQSKRAAHRSYTKDASNNLSVAITCDRTGILSEDVSHQILDAIHNQIISEACSSKQDTPGPTFNAQPLFAEGILNLWCGNDHTLIWLKNAVSRLSLPSACSLVVKRQSEIQKRVYCRVVLPLEQGVFKQSTDIWHALYYQNPWVDVKRWLPHEAQKRRDRRATWTLVFGVPEDHIPILMKAGRRLSIGLGVVYVMFKHLNGTFAIVPQGWDAAIANQPQP